MPRCVGVRAHSRRARPVPPGYSGARGHHPEPLLKYPADFPHCRGNGPREQGCAVRLPRFPSRPRTIHNMRSTHLKGLVYGVSIAGFGEGGRGSARGPRRRVSSRRRHGSPGETAHRLRRPRAGGGRQGHSAAARDHTGCARLSHRGRHELRRDRRAHRFRGRLAGRGGGTPADRLDPDSGPGHARGHRRRRTACRR